VDDDNGKPVRDLLARWPAERTIRLDAGTIRDTLDRLSAVRPPAAEAAFYFRTLDRLDALQARMTEEPGTRAFLLFATDPLDAKYLETVMRTWEATVSALARPGASPWHHRQARFTPAQIAAFLAVLWMLLIALPLIQLELPPSARATIDSETGTIGVGLGVTALVQGRRKP
jgi:hypothetical protein